MNTIKERRLALGMSQAALAEAIGSTQSTVSAWERGSKVPFAKNIHNMCVLFQCSLDGLGLQLPALKSRCSLSAEQAHQGNPDPAREYIERRLEVGLTQAQLAEKSGVSLKTIKRMETGKCRPNWDNRQKLRRALGIPEERFFSVQERNTKFLELEKYISITIKKNWRLVRATRMEYEDIYQELSLQMLRAIDRYEGKNEANLKTFFEKTLEYKFKAYLFRHCMHGLSGNPDTAPRFVFSSLDAMLEARFELEEREDMEEPWRYKENRPWC